MKTLKLFFVVGSALSLFVISGSKTLWAAQENHNVQLPTGSTYYLSFPIEVKTAGTIKADITCENEINMPEGRELTANPYFVIIYKKDLNKQLHNMAYKYFMNSLTLKHEVSASELNQGTDYIVGVRNTNARVKGDCSLNISYPTPEMKPLKKGAPLKRPTSKMKGVR